MSFRLFIYYCAMLGGCAAFLGWMIGRLITIESPVLQSAIKGMWLGLYVAFVLGLLEAIWNLPLSATGKIASRAGTALLIGAVGGLLAGAAGQMLYGLASIFLLLGWTLTGLLIGIAPAAFEVWSAGYHGEDWSGPLRRMRNGAIGGAAGGFLGGLFFFLLESFWTAIFTGEPARLWSPSATGFVLLGIMIGLLIGLAQVILREAWLRVEKGFRPGRELLLSKEETTIGRAESSDLGLFGDPAIGRLHARILRTEQHFLLEDAGTPSGTFLNGESILEPTPLQHGDKIQVGKSVVRFGEITKRASGQEIQRPQARRTQGR